MGRFAGTCKASGMSTSEASRAAPLARRVPPQLFFVISAVFHYLGPACAVLLFARVEVLGVAWLRIAAAALVFTLWRRPWRLWRRSSPADRRTLLALGLVLAAMNGCFYLAIARLPLATVGAIEFLGPIGLALAGLHSRRNVVALGLAAAGVAMLTQLRLEGDALGYALAFANGGLFVGYIMLGHRVAGAGGVDGLAVAMLVALAAISPIALGPALPALADPALLLAGIGVGIASSVIPYVCDQLAMARLPRASFALMLSLLPATAAGIGVLVLGQVPSPRELAGIGLVMAGVALHRAARA
ncbi:EamA family transporter [Inquilinus limosus]|uniref:EamA family transporter n=2 Tax=Inquilinus limosus TaxID=171674 RepID=A0A211ZID2_9PROT|nr:EamA family transporter [Inquilinus limosus]